MLLGTVAGGAIAMALILPLTWKWHLRIRRVAVGLVAILVAGSLLGFVLGAALGLPRVGVVLLGCVLTVISGAIALAYRMYRDPERIPPQGEHLIVSPADGEIVYIKHSCDGSIPVSTKHGKQVALAELTRTKVHEGESVVVGIGMSLIDVHVNRAPIAGEIVLRRRFSGRFGSLRIAEMVFENERATTLIKGRGVDVAVVQIASRLVRQIVAKVHEGENVIVGQRIGAILLGSQVDLVIPNRTDLRLLVRVGDRVQAGTSVIAQVAHTET